MHSLFVLVPLGLTAVLALMIWRGKGPHPASYKVSEPWKHSPILWAADEPAAHHTATTGRSVQADSAADGGNVGEHHENTVTIGGGASGKW
ncbi:aa3-type cytochrome oxidase subunit CtaJ [Mycolicibacterium baixiangningiae]|uniref:aa3-type cytochrome oxidase subunit CtaJ n=1 Tax=Mycolicibacterium baixiangningiae TaxID=2761578 RepID=UPI0018693DF6|nr:hypothetical protein [Mycolicibacterium baixiangningiae]